MPDVPMIWAAVSRALPSTAMLSTVGGASSWAQSAAGAPPREATAAEISRKRCISNGWRVSTPDPSGCPAYGALSLRAGQRPECQPLAVGCHIHLDLVAAAEVSHQDPLAERILDVALDGALEGSSAEVLVVAVIDQELDRSGREPDLVTQAPLHLAQQNRDDLRDVVFVERVKDDNVVEPVQELRVEDLVHLFFHRLLHLLEAALLVPAMEAERLPLHDVPG